MTKTGTCMAKGHYLHLKRTTPELYDYRNLWRFSKSPKGVLVDMVMIFADTDNFLALKKAHDIIHRIYRDNGLKIKGV